MSADFEKKPNKSSRMRPKWYAWLILLLLPLAMSSPIIGGNLQLRIVGSERGPCCMNWTQEEYDELQARAQAARRKRSLSDSIMNGCMMGGIVLLFVFALLFYFLIWEKLGQVDKIFSGVLVVVAVMLIMLWLIHLLEWYSAHTDEYYQYAYYMSWPFV